jgi:hypothetical protein
MAPAVILDVEEITAMDLADEGRTILPMITV